MGDVGATGTSRPLVVRHYRKLVDNNASSCLLCAYAPWGVPRFLRRPPSCDCARDRTATDFSWGCPTDGSSSIAWGMGHRFTRASWAPMPNHAHLLAQERLKKSQTG